ncbi:hypothetical protein DFQ28_001243, partial [Apophysomyces sp. BC1034]
MFVKRDEMHQWATMVQDVDSALTEEAFNGVYYAFLSVFLAYAVTSLFGILSAILYQMNGGTMPNNSTYTPVAVPGKYPVAGGSDKSQCIDLINQLVIGSAIIVFIGNFIQ